MIVYYIYKDKALHSKTWSVQHFTNDLQAYYKDVRRLPIKDSEYMRFKADGSIYAIYTQFKGMTI